MSGRIEDLPDADLALRLADEATEKWPELAEYLRSVGDFIQRSKGCALVPDVRPGDHIEVVRRIRYGPIPADPAPSSSDTGTETRP